MKNLDEERRVVENPLVGGGVTIIGSITAVIRVLV